MPNIPCSQCSTWEAGCSFEGEIIWYPDNTGLGEYEKLPKEALRLSPQLGEEGFGSESAC